MNDSRHDSAFLTRYLLGDLPEDEATALEAQYVADSRVFEEVEKAESDLVDDYVRGTLTGTVREQFERHYLAHPRRRERVKFAEALLATLNRTERPSPAPVAPAVSARPGWRARLDALFAPRPAFGLALAALVMASGVWVVYDLRRTPPEPGSETARTTEGRGSPEPKDQAAAGAPAGQPAAPRPSSVIALALTAGSGVRGAGTASPIPLVIPPDAAEVRLQVSLEAPDYPSYRLILRRIGGGDVLRTGELPVSPSAAGSSVTVNVPASQFDAGDYTLTLQGAIGGGGFEDVSRYLIRAERR